MLQQSNQHDEIRPWNWGFLEFHDGPVEIVSYPTPNCGRPDTVMVRLKPGDPTTLAEVDVTALRGFHPSQHEWFHREKIFYSSDLNVYFFRDDMGKIAEPCDECAGFRWPEEQHEEHCSLFEEVR
jgi:hypothetical protein